MKKSLPPTAIERATLRLPRDLYLELQDDAEKNGIAMNSVIIERLRQKPLADQLEAQGKEISEIKRMISELLER